MSMQSSADALEKAFDTGENMEEYFDFDNAMQPNREQKRVNVDFPQWMIAGLDSEAARLGINRQAVIKIWIAERLDAKVSQR